MESTPTPLPGSSPDEMFPALTTQQQARVLAHGRSRKVRTVPNSAWVEVCVARDGAGFIKTGSDLSKEDLERAKWPLARAPYFLETRLPGVFRRGDVRCG